MSYLERTLELDPDNMFALVATLDAQAERGRCNSADEILQTIRHSDFDDWPAAKNNFVHALAGSVYRNCPALFDPELARANCEVAVPEEDSVFGPYPGQDYRVGVVLYRMGRYEEAWESLVRANEEEESEGTQLFISMTAVRLSQAAEARTHFDRALAVREESALRNSPDTIALRDETADLLKSGTSN